MTPSEFTTVLRQFIMKTEEGNVFSCDSLRATNLTAFQQAVFAKRAMALCRQLSASMPEDLREQSVRSLLESLIDEARTE